MNKLEAFCCFTGHRHVPKEKLGYVRAALSKEILARINEGVRSFICGGALGFDTLAALMVLEYKALFPEVSLVLYLPCKNQAERWGKKDTWVYNDILKKADEVVYFAEKYVSGCMHLRNRKMVESSGCCIAFLEKNSGGTFFTVRCALKQGKKVIYI